MSLLSFLRSGSSTIDPDPIKPTTRGASDVHWRWQAHNPLPSTEQGWRERYNWLFDWYAGQPYTNDDVKDLRLFKAVDTDGKILAMAQRLNRDAQFVVDTDTYALSGGRWSLETFAGVDSSTLRAGQQVWQRSGLQAHKAAWIRAAAKMGDCWLEAVRFDGGSRLVAYDPRHCTPEYMPDGITLETLTVQIEYFGEPDANGDRALHVYKRVITANEIIVTEMGSDGVPVEITGESGKHGLGVPPVGHLRMTEIVGCPEHSLWAGHGLDLPMAAMDSMVAHMRAISERYAHPHIVAKGARLGGDGFEQLGRAFMLPEKGELSYLEPALAGIQPLWEMTQGYLQDVRGTVPEFILSGTGANTSGRALEFRADQFRRKMIDAQTRVNAVIAQVTGYAVMLDAEVKAGGSDPFRIMAPPPLPIDRAQHVTHVSTAVREGLMLREDGVRQMQAIGLIDEEIDAVQYAARLQEEAAGGGGGDVLGKLPLAAQQLALARERAVTAGDAALAARLGEIGEQMAVVLAESLQPQGVAGE